MIINDLKKKANTIIQSNRIIKIISLLVFVYLMASPFTMDQIDLLNKTSTPEYFYPLTILFSNNIQNGFNFFYISCCLVVFILPATFLFTLLVLFFESLQKKIPKYANLLLYISIFISLTIYLSSFISGMIKYANTHRWFQSLSNFSYIAFFIAFVLHIILVTKGIIYIKIKDEAYLNSKKILNNAEKEDTNSKKPLQDKQTTVISNKDLSIGQLKIKKIFHRIKIQIDKATEQSHLKTKIVGVFMITIIVILSTFIYSDLNNYKALLTQNVNTAGMNKAEQSSAIYVFSDGLHAKIQAFLEGIKKTNNSAPFPFKRLDIITTNTKYPVVIEKINDFTIYPKFDVFSYTTAVGYVKEIPTEEKQITAKDAKKYIDHFQNENTTNLPILQEEKGTCLYVYPIFLQRKGGSRLIGFSVVTYLTEILEKPYFQAKVFVFSIAAVFLYCSMIITIFLADFIAAPIILLCVNIRKTANILSDMLSGNAQIESERLRFDSDVKTNDEISNLSQEIKNIVSIVRGVLPYVSFHTLQNADKKINDKSSKRNLCFLFTDIRGFTTMCENMPPRKVTSILNHYLDIETKIIFENDGDIDKYVGDEVMAFFSGAKKEINACNAAMQIKQAMQDEANASIKAGDEPISIGIGIHSGPVVFGPVGSKTRKDFTAIGDTVNLAARLEGANKVYGSKSIISETVYNNLKDKFICRELDLIAVKGKKEAVRIFEILQATEDCPEEKLLDLKTNFEKGLNYYRKRKWENAEKYFTECLEKYNDAPAKVFLKRTSHYKNTPPKPRWKGVFVMSSK